MPDTSDFRIGLIIKFKNDLYQLTDFQHVKPGKGGAFVRTTLKSLKSGRVLDNTFRSGENIEVIRVERRKYQFLYREDDSLVCMDQEVYDQINVPLSYFGNGIDYLKEGTDLDFLMNKEEIVTVEIPNFVVLKVTETEPGVRGDTATSAMKNATLETGAAITVPLFINAGDSLKVDTRTGAYMERVKS